VWVLPLNQVSHFLNEVAELLYLLNGRGGTLFGIAILVNHTLIFDVVGVFRLSNHFLTLAL
jgi:hypothetical protein